MRRPGKLDCKDITVNDEMGLSWVHVMLLGVEKGVLVALLTCVM